MLGANIERSKGLMKETSVGLDASVAAKKMSARRISTGSWLRFLKKQLSSALSFPP